MAGSIKSDAVATAFSRACRFNIKAPSSKRVKINCPTVNSPDNVKHFLFKKWNKNVEPCVLASAVIVETLGIKTKVEKKNLILICLT